MLPTVSAAPRSALRTSPTTLLPLTVARLGLAVDDTLTRTHRPLKDTRRDDADLLKASLFGGVAAPAFGPAPPASCGSRDCFAKK